MVRPQGRRNMICHELNLDPIVGEVRSLVINKAHKSIYPVHLRSDKTYLDLKKLYWRPNMKAKIATYSSKYLNCSNVKIEYQKPSGLLQQPSIP